MEGLPTDVGRGDQKVIFLGIGIKVLKVPEWMILLSEDELRNGPTYGEAK